MPWDEPGPAAVLAVVALCGAFACWPAVGADPTAGARRGGAGVGRLWGRHRVARGWRAAVVFVTGPVRRRAARRRRGEAVVTVLDALAAGLEAGLPPPLALREAAGAAEEPVVHAVFASAARDGGPGGVAAGLVEGLPPVEASLPGAGRAVRGDAAAVRAEASAEVPMVGLHDRSGLEGVALLARAWWLSERLGSPLAEAVRTVATLLRADLAARRAVASAMAEARATVLVLVALPVLGPLLALAVGVSPGELYGSGAAVASTAMGVALSGAGYVWMRRLLRRVADVGEHA